MVECRICLHVNIFLFKNLHNQPTKYCQNIAILSLANIAYNTFGKISACYIELLGYLLPQNR